MNSEKVSINNGVGAIKIADNDVYEGIAKDDIVVVSTLYANKATASDAYTIVTKAETIEGTLDGYNGTEKVTVDGTTYDIAGLNENVDPDFVTGFSNQIGESYTLYLIDGIVYAAEQTSDGTKNYAVVESAAGQLNNKLNPLKVAIMKADGEEATVEVHKDSIEAANNKSKLSLGSIIKYSDVSDGVIKITEIKTPTQAAEGSGESVYNSDTKKFSDTVTSADSVLFVNKTDNATKAGDFYVYSIRDLDDISVADTGYYGSMTDDNKVVAAYVTLGSKPNGASSDTVYGIVSAENGTVSKDGDTYTSYTVDLSEETQKTVLIAGDSDTTLREGDLVAFDVATDDVYSTKDITVCARVENGKLDNLPTGVIKGFAGEYEDGVILTYYGTKADLDKKENPTTVPVSEDVQIIYVDAAENTAGTDTGVVHDGISKKANFVAVYEDYNNTKSIVAIFVADDSNIIQ